MRSHRFAPFAFCILLLGAVWAGVVIAVPPDGEPPGDDVRESELVVIRQEIGRLKTQLAEMKSRESSLEDRLQQTRVELQLQEEQLREATAAYELASARAGAAQAKIEELEHALEGVRGDLRRRLGGLYRLGRQGYLRLFLALEPNHELLPAIRQLRFLVRRDQEALESYRRTRQDLAQERVRLAAQESAMEEWQRRESERRSELVNLRRRQERLLEEVVRERRQLAERTDQLVDKERKLSRLIASLVGDQKGLDGTPIQDFRGALDWPAQGELVGRFGPRRDPRYKTEVPHNGIDIALDGDRQIRAVFPGQVLFASPFEGYGQMVVVHHPGRVFTLYSGLAELFVHKGDVLSLGTVIGNAADELYFEIRRENQPENPLLWLR